MDDPYVTTIIDDQIVLTADKITKDLYNNIKRKLIKIQEKKCNEYGFVNKVYQLLDYKHALVLDHGSILFDIQYQATVCSPKKDDLIDATVNKIHVGIISAYNGPIRIWINTSNKINMETLGINKNKEIFHKKSGNILKPDDKIIVKVLETEFLPNDKDIRVYGYLEDLKESSEEKSLKE